MTRRKISPGYPATLSPCHLVTLSSSSPPITKAIPEKIFQFRDRVNLPNGRVDIVFDAAIPNGVVVEQNVAGTPVAIARLADRANVAQRLAAIETMDILDFFRTAELVQVVGHLLDEDTWYMRMALKAIALHQGEDAFHFALIVNVFREDIFIERITRRTVDEQKAVFAESARSFGQELPAFLAERPSLVRRLELIAGPKDSSFGRRIEAIRIEQCSLIVIAQQNDFALHHQINALAWVRSIADHIAKAVNIGDGIFFNVFEDGLQRLKVTVDIADNRLHA